MTPKHINIPIFVPHLGCPNDCVFCNQKKITGCQVYNPNNAKIQIQEHLKTIDKKSTSVQIAFFGGSFTGIDKNSMISMLEIANHFIKQGEVDSIRLSTRPDYINTDILNILKMYNVTDIELGIQSMNDAVLNACGRGHSSNDTKQAAKLIIDNGLNFVGQMMVGLPCSNLEMEIETARSICELGAVAVRIYPTLIFSGTALEEMYKIGTYTPLTINEAAQRCGKLIKIFNMFNIPIIRLGLCETDNLRTDGSIVAGPYHPAIGELCENQYYLDEIENLLDARSAQTANKNLTVFVSKGNISKAIGQQKTNKISLQNKYFFKSIKFKESENLEGRNINIALD